VKGLEGIELLEWHAETEAGARFMDTSTHTVTGEVLSQGTTYTFKIKAPAGLHPDELLSALRGAQVTKVVEPHREIETLTERLRIATREGVEWADKTQEELKGRQKAEAALKSANLQLAARTEEDKDNKARMDALSLLGQTMDDHALERLVKVELDGWLRGLEEFNMTRGEARELHAMLIRLAKEVYARAEVLRNRARCACLLESLQKEEPSESKLAEEAEEGEDQLF